MEKKVEKKEKIIDLDKERYDPRREYYNRLNDAQRAGMARVANHRFSSDFGGCADNYRY